MILGGGGGGGGQQPVTWVSPFSFSGGVDGRRRSRKLNHQFTQTVPLSYSFCVCVCVCVCVCLVRRPRGGGGKKVPGFFCVRVKCESAEGPTCLTVVCHPLFSLLY